MITIFPSLNLLYCPLEFFHILLLPYCFPLQKSYDISYGLPYHVRTILSDFQGPTTSFLKVLS